MPERWESVDKDFLQDSWLEMQAILDREMPVVKIKRRGIIFFLLFLFTALLTAMLLLNPFSGKKEYAEPQKTLPDNSVYRAHEATAENLNEPEQNSDQYSNTETDVEDANAKGKTSLHNLQDNVNITGDPTVRQMSSHSPHSVITRNDDEVSKVEPLTRGLEENTAALYNEDENIIKFRDEDFNFSKLSTPYIVISTTNQPIEIKKSYSLTQPIPKTGDGGPGIYLDSRIADYQSFNLDVGIVYELQLGETVSAYGGAGYGFDDYKEKQLAPAILTSRFSVSGLMSADLLSVIQAKEYAKGNYLSLRVGMKYKIFRNLKVSGIFQYRVFGSDLMRNELAVTAPEDASSPGPVADAGNAVVEIRNRNDHYLGLGLQYRLSSNIALETFFLVQGNHPYRIDYPGSTGLMNAAFLEKRKEWKLGVLINY